MLKRDKQGFEMCISFEKYTGRVLVILLTSVKIPYATEIRVTRGKKSIPVQYTFIQKKIIFNHSDNVFFLLFIGVSLN